MIEENININSYVALTGAKVIEIVSEKNMVRIGRVYPHGTYEYLELNYQEALKIWETLGNWITSEAAVGGK